MGRRIKPSFQVFALVMSYGLKYRVKNCEWWLPLMLFVAFILPFHDNFEISTHFQTKSRNCNHILFVSLVDLSVSSMYYM